ncbi:AfsR/SARP family transcriptional regulator [Streptacidiphilus sp. PB12-B1b]|uniref:BTAD domain-containing putative transcriptional regulator n=1 Tax=Streptacidiphilus sp. PB12-B1b TaxID=2705012 RepID=UPI0015FB14B0|nr:BTAD domain-containing putative transcriptional regulator [Streptacidiphilus sp. PB12-B1b]QMU76259.1 AfsR/SARP family transcriptional regulator [Streptacidiphilus sp. PB12-B1b]
MRFGILGSTRAWTGAGDAAALGGSGRRALLVLLALDAGRTVPVQRLVDGLYGERPPAGVGNALQSQVSRLRAALRRPGEPDPIVGDRAGYRLAVEPDAVDAHRFVRLAAQGRRALLADDPATASALLGEALALWRGPALADIADAPFAAAQTIRLEEARLTATEDLLRTELALGRHHEAVAELRELVAAHPLRERLSALLVLALHGDGRRAEALDAYAQARDALVDALGADPGSELAEAQLVVLRGGQQQDPETKEVTYRHLSLPVQLNGMVGRAGELARIQELLQRVRLLVVTGPGGAGKTRVAVEAAARHPGDSCFADLSGLTEGDSLPTAVLGALGLRGSALRGQAEGPTPQARLTAALTDRHLLLVLDNCEHLVADAARFAAELLAACPGLRILATSREALGITGEQLLPLPPLPGEAAVQLFHERATAVQPDFDPRREAEPVAEICDRLDGLPLAIELAAARLRVLTTRQIVARLDDRFRLLTGGSRTARPRQQTLRAVVDWSWELLPQAERAVLRRASVLSGGWTLTAAEAVCADAGAEAGAGPGVGPDDVLALIAALVDKSLVTAQQPEHPGGEVRYRLLQTVRAYAAERLDESGERQRAEQAHLEHFLGLAATANPLLRTAEQLDWLHRLAADDDNLHAALRRADTRTALRMVGELSPYWMLRGLRYEGASHARRVLEALDPGPVPGLEEEYAICVILAVSIEDDHGALSGHLAAGERLMLELRRTPRRNPTLVLLWAPYSGIPEDFDQLTPQEADLWSADPWHRGLVHLSGGFRHWYLNGDSAAAVREFGACVALYRELGDRWGQILGLNELSVVTHASGDRARSRMLSAEALRLAEELGSTEDIADLLCGRAERALRDGDVDAAEADCERAVGLFQHIGSAAGIPRARLCQAAAARLRGDLDAAATLCRTALDAAPPGWFGGVWLRVDARVELARIALAAGDAATAHRWFREALPPGVDVRNLPALADAAEALAGLALVEGEPAHAARLQGVSEALRRGAAPADQDHQRFRAQARAALGDADYARAHARGAALIPAEAVAALVSHAQRQQPPPTGDSSRRTDPAR